MKNWLDLEPDKIKLLTKHYTPGRGGRRIDMVVIHHNAGILDTDGCWQVWQTREASAHYQVEASGVIGQLVWDRDTAWHAANADINARSIGIEHANTGGAAAGWPISEQTIDNGAHLVAAICHYYKLGPPRAGVNVRFHCEFTTTSCPVRLAPGGPDHARYMQRAAFWYEQMTNPPKENDMTPEQDKMLREVHRELTQRYPSRADARAGIPADKQFRDTLVGYVLEADAKLELAPGSRLADRLDALETRISELEK